MRTLTFERLRESTLTRMGVAVDTTDLLILGAVTTYLGDRIREAWEGYYWPDTTALEARVYCERWSDVEEAEIISGQILYHANAYWQALTNAPAGEPAAGSAEWMATNTFVHAIALEQVGKTPISEVVEVWDRNPRLDRKALAVAFDLTEVGILVADDAPAEVWVEFSLQVSEFRATPWAAEAAYVTGDLIFYAKECWRAVVGTTGSAPALDNAAWALQPVPWVLSRFAERAAYSDSLAEDGQQDKAERELRRAYQALDDEFCKLAHKQGQVARWGVRTG